MTGPTDQSDILLQQEIQNLTNDIGVNEAVLDHYRTQNILSPHQLNQLELGLNMQREELEGLKNTLASLNQTPSSHIQDYR